MSHHFSTHPKMMIQGTAIKAVYVTNGFVGEILGATEDEAKAADPGTAILNGLAVIPVKPAEFAVLHEVDMTMEPEAVVAAARHLAELAIQAGAITHEGKLHKPEHLKANAEAANAVGEEAKAKADAAKAAEAAAQPGASAVTTTTTPPVAPPVTPPAETVATTDPTTAPDVPNTPAPVASAPAA